MLDNQNFLLKLVGCSIFSGTYRVKAFISYKKQTIRLCLTNLKKYTNFCIRNAFCWEERCSIKFSEGIRPSPENNLRNKEAMLRKMYESSELLKLCQGKCQIVWFFYPIRNPLISHFYLSISPKILQVLIFFIFLSVLELVPQALYTTLTNFFLKIHFFYTFKTLK